VWSNALSKIGSIFMNYLLLGQEEYLKHRFLKKIKDEAFKKDITQADLDVFVAGESTIHDILNAFRTFPFLSKRRIIIIKKIEKFSQREKELVLNYLKTPSASTDLILESSSNGSTDFFRELGKYVKTIKCGKLKAAEIVSWIINELSERHKKISPYCANILKEHVGDDLLLLTNEINKLVTFVGAAGEITEQHMSAVLSINSSKTVFDLLDFILERKTDKALALLERLLVRERPHQILNLIAWQFRSLARIKDLDPKLSVYEIARSVRLNRRSAKRASEQSKHFTRTHLADSMKIIMDTDLAIKTGNIRPRYALESVLIRLCATA